MSFLGIGKSVDPMSVWQHPHPTTKPTFSDSAQTSRSRLFCFFKWIKPHLRIKAFYGLSENGVKTRIWIAVSVYVLVAIVRKRLGLDASLYDASLYDASLYQIIQILSLSLFEKTPVLRHFSHRTPRPILPILAIT